MNPEPKRITRRRTGPRPVVAGKGKCKVARLPRFASWGDAAAAAIYLSGGRRLRAMPCEACAGWHITRFSTPPKDTRC